MGEVALNMDPASCLRCGIAEAILGSAFCAACKEALEHPAPSRAEPRAEQGKAVKSRRLPMRRTFNQHPNYPRKA